jgi:cyclin B
MKDENFNPNITGRIKPKINSTKRAISNTNINRINQINSTINLIEDNDIEMKIENISHHEIKPKSEKKIDVQNADEYFDDICQELFSHEDNCLVDPKYMSNQSDINHRMRAILIDWLIDVHLKYKLVPQTMYIAVNLIDRYLEKNETNRAKLQLVGVTAMFIACKYEEIYPPDLKDFVYITDGAYVKQDVLDMEYKMLKSLEFNITFPTQWSIFEIYKKKLDLDDKTFKLAWFLMELCLIDYKILKFKMSYIAASAILIAIKTLGIYRSDFSSVIGIEENQLEECCKEIYNYYVYNSTHNLQAIRKKFAMTRYNEVSKIKLC